MAQVVADAVDAWRDGKPPDPQLLAREHPDLRAEIESQLETIEALEASRLASLRRRPR
jgi:hypothetical protein